MGIYDCLLDLIRQHGSPKLGRWVYCKYCYKNVLPRLSLLDGLIQCTECLSGLAPLKDVIVAGSYEAWERDLWSAWHLLHGAEADGETA